MICDSIESSLEFYIKSFQNAYSFILSNNSADAFLLFVDHARHFVLPVWIDKVFFGIEIWKDFHEYLL
jgi:hypothetical protein